MVSWWPPLRLSSCARLPLGVSGRPISLRCPRHTSGFARWQVFWREQFPQTPFWKAARARLVPLLEIVALHPVTGHDVRVAAGTIKRWYYTALRQEDDRVGSLHRAGREDYGKISLASTLAERLVRQFRDYPHRS